MTVFPITPLVRRVQRLIFETFEVSETQAQEHAAEMVALAEGWGGLESAERLDWNYRVRKDLGETRIPRWRSETEQRKFEAIERQKYDAWNAIIGDKPRA